MKIAFFGYKLDSGNEAISNQFQILSKELNTEIVSFNDNHISLKNKKIKLPKNKILKKISVIKYWRKFEKCFDIIFFHSSLNSILFKFIKKEKYVHFLTKDFKKDKILKKYLKIAPKFKSVIVQNKNLSQKLKKHKIGNIIFTYPCIKEEKIKNRQNKDFTILFLSSPTGKDSIKKYESKGVKLLLDSFENTKNNKLILIWRNSCLKYVQKDIKNNKRKKDISLINKKINIKDIIKKADCIVIPYKSKLQSPDYPLSAIEALMFNKPVICSNTVEMSDIIKKEKCGVTFNSKEEELTKAIKICKNNHQTFKNNANKTYRKYFSCKENIQKIREKLKL